MKRNRFTENQIVSILKEAESGISVPELMPQVRRGTKHAV